MPIDATCKTSPTRPQFTASASARDDKPLVREAISARITAWTELLTHGASTVNGRTSALAAACSHMGEDDRAKVQNALAAAAAAAAPHVNGPTHHTRPDLGRRFCRSTLAPLLAECDRRTHDQGLTAAITATFPARLPGVTVEPSAHEQAVRCAIARLRRALDTLVKVNMGLVRSEVQRRVNAKRPLRSLTAADLVQEGAIGLLRGFRTFDPDRGFALSTYVVWWIRQAIDRAIADKDEVVRAPVHLRETTARIFQAQAALGEDATVEQIVAYTGRGRSAVETALTQYPRTIDASGGEGGDHRKGRVMGEGAPVAFFDRIPDPSPWDLMERLAQEQMGAIAASAVRLLSAGEREIIERRYQADEPSSLKDIGDERGLSRERIRQIEVKALGRLRRRLAPFMTASA